MPFKITVFICALWLGTGIGGFLSTNQKMYKIDKHKIWYIAKEENKAKSYQLIPKTINQETIECFYTTDKKLWDFLMFKILFIITLIGMPLAIVLDKKKK